MTYAGVYPKRCLGRGVVCPVPFQLAKSVVNAAYATALSCVLYFENELTLHVVYIFSAFFFVMS